MPEWKQLPVPPGIHGKSSTQKMKQKELNLAAIFVTNLLCFNEGT